MSKSEDLFRLKITSTIPTGQYANMQPEVEGVGATYEDAEADALAKTERIWNRVCEPGKELRIAQPVTFDTTQTNNYEIQVSVYNGVEVLFDPITHTYVDNEGNKYLSGSTFASQYKSKFDAEAIGTRFAEKHGVSPYDVKSMWKLNGDTSTALGSAIHNALELYGKYLQLSLATKGTNESALHKNEILRPIVEAFYNGRENEKARYELFVADKKNKLCGFIDRLLIVDEKNKVCRIQDYKTNPDISKAETIKAPFKGVVANTTLGAYWLQLSFYAFILQGMGWTVEGLDIYNWSEGEWKYYSSDVVDISGEINK